MSKLALPFQRVLAFEFRDELEKLRGLIAHLGELTVTTDQDAKHLWDECVEGMRLMSFMCAKGIIWKSCGEVYAQEKKKGGFLCDDAPTASTSVSPPSSTKSSPK